MRKSRENLISLSKNNINWKEQNCSASNKKKDDKFLFLA